MIYKPNQNSLKIPPITLEKTRKIISQLQSTNSTGFDPISNKILKKINHTISPHITHLINSILRSSTYSNIFKIFRMLPLSKPEKDSLLIDSYRPINNLPTIEKLVEQYIIEHMVDFLNEN